MGPVVVVEGWWGGEEEAEVGGHGEVVGRATRAWEGLVVVGIEMGRRGGR